MVYREGYRVLFVRPLMSLPANDNQTEFERWCDWMGDDPSWYE